MDHVPAVFIWSAATHEYEGLYYNRDGIPAWPRKHILLKLSKLYLRMREYEIYMPLDAFSKTHGLLRPEKQKNKKWII